MKNNNHNGQPGPTITEPTSAEIIKTIETVKKQYRILLSWDDAIEFAKLTQELAWWQIAEEEIDPASELAKDISAIAQEYLKTNQGKNISQAEAYKKAMGSLAISASMERKRISDQMETILSKY